MGDMRDLGKTTDEFVQTAALDREERRASPRFAYPAVKPVAPYDGVRFPTNDMFREVRFHDLSADGMSFIWPHAPDFERVVIKTATNLRLVARVKHCRQLDNADREFLVGCQFTDAVQVTGQCYV